MALTPEISSPTGWLAPFGQICWSSGTALGSVLALAETQLKLSMQSTQSFEFKSARINLQISWNQETLSLSGRFTPTSVNSEILFHVGEEDWSVLAELLTQMRKSQHIAICRERDVEATDHYTGFSEISFIPEALPDLNMSELDLSRSFLGRTFSAPLLITGMTGGVAQGQEINYRLARAAQHFNIPMGVGSQRLALENSRYRSIFAVKDHVPDIFLIANLGGSQLTGSNAIELCQDAVAMISADALAIHLNVVQECIQVEGSPHFKGLLNNLAKITRRLTVPVIVKEVGSGISPTTAKRLVEAGVGAIDCSGKGGTSWGYIEGLRSAHSETLPVAESFRDWGIPTAYSLACIRDRFPSFPLIATGGIRDGLSVAKAVALGAHMVGIGLPLLRAAVESEERVFEVLNTLTKGLKTTMVATNSKKLEQLKDKIVLGKPLAQDFQAVVTKLVTSRI